MSRARSLPKQSPLPTLLAICALLSAMLLNWYLLTEEIDISPAEADIIADARTLGDVPGLPAVAPKSIETSFPETLARPLFWESRRPLEAQPSKVTAPQRARTSRQIAGLPEDLELIGIVKERGHAGRALIRSGGKTAGEWIEIGHVLNGWRLSRIETGSVVFDAEGQQQKLTLFPDKAE